MSNVYLISPHFQLFYFYERLDFCDKKDQKDQSYLFSEPSLIIFTKGTNNYDHMFNSNLEIHWLFKTA